MLALYYGGAIKDAKNIDVSIENGLNWTELSWWVESLQSHEWGKPPELLSRIDY